MITDQLRSGLETFDLTQLAWAADGFAMEDLITDRGGLDQLLSIVEGEAPSTLEDAMWAASVWGAFGPFMIAMLARHQGIGEDLNASGVLSEPPPAVAGDLQVDGPLICDIEHWLLVAGDVSADYLITSADVIINGTASFTHGVIGVNSWNQSLWIRGPLSTPGLIADDYSVEALAEDLSLDDAKDLLRPGLVQRIREWQSKRGPDYAVRNLHQMALDGKPIFASQS